MKARRTPSRARRRTFAPAPKVRPERTGPLRAEILSVGRELLRGEIVDTNSRVVARALAQRGGIVERVTVVDDSEAAIAATLREALGRSPHVVVTTGGLGPAPDDHTMAAVAQALSLPLALNIPARAMIEAAYRRLERSGMAESSALTLTRERMCHIPVGATPVANRLGVAPGIVCRLTGGAAVICLPGAGREMRAVLEDALPLVSDLPDRIRFARRDVESPTADESALRPLLEQLARDYPDVWVASRAVRSEGPPRVVVTLEVLAPTASEAESRVERVCKRLLALASGSR